MVEYFEIGQISNTHGLKGEIKVRAFTKEQKRFEELSSILIDFKGELKKYDIEKIRYQKDFVLLKLKNVDDIDEALKLKGNYIKIPRNDAKETDENEFFIADLIGCEVYEDDLIGIVDDVFTAGASDVYVIKRKGKKDLLIPAIESVIKKVDVSNKRIDVKIPRGLDEWDLMY